MDSKAAAQAIAKSNDLTVKQLGLRFDRVAMAMLWDLRNCADLLIPKGKILIVTVTAPIRLSSKTTRAIEEKMAKLASKKTIGPVKMAVHGNRIQLKILKIKEKKLRFLGFVHNPTTPASNLLKLAERWLAADA